MAKRTTYKIVAERPDGELVLYGTSHRRDYAEDLARALSGEVITRQVVVVKGIQIKTLFHERRKTSDFAKSATLYPSEYRK